MALDLESKHVNRLPTAIDLDEAPAMAEPAATGRESETPSVTEATPGSPATQPAMAEPAPDSDALAPIPTPVDGMIAVPTTEPVPEPAASSTAASPGTDPDGMTGPQLAPTGSDSAPVPERRSIRAGDRTAPRVPSKFAIFAEGEHVVYPTHGVGKVAKIGTEEIAGDKLELIHITFAENQMTLRVPISKARSAGLRKLATRKLFDEVLALLKGRARTSRAMWSRRALEYHAKINSGDPLATAEVVRDLYRRPGKDEASFSERQIYDAALDRLAGELAALDETDRGAAVAKITNWLDGASAAPPSSAV